MKTSRFRMCVVAAALLPAVALAAPDAKGKKRAGAPAHHEGANAEVLKTFDKNGDHQIDADELPALQKAFSTLKNLDKNGNGEIELAEVEKPQAPASGDRKGRMMEHFKQIDKNGNHKIDADEVEALQKMAAGGKIMSRLDQNGNGKLDPDEVERLNQHIGQSGGKRPRSPATPAPSVRKAPEKPAETPPATAPKPEEKKPEPPAPEAKPPGNFGN